jgi:hypothetical protein
MQCTVGVANWAMRYREFVIRGRYELRTREREVCCQRDESGAPRGAQWPSGPWRGIGVPWLHPISPFSWPGISSRHGDITRSLHTVQSIQPFLVSFHFTSIISLNLFDSGKSRFVHFGILVSWYRKDYYEGSLADLKFWYLVMQAKRWDGRQTRTGERQISTLGVLDCRSNQPSTPGHPC